jgi:hypothetical protein
MGTLSSRFRGAEVSTSTATVRRDDFDDAVFAVHVRDADPPSPSPGLTQEARRLAAALGVVVYLDRPVDNARRGGFVRTAACRPPACTRRRRPTPRVSIYTRDRAGHHAPCSRRRFLEQLTAMFADESMNVRQLTGSLGERERQQLSVAMRLAALTKKDHDDTHYEHVHLVQYLLSAIRARPHVVRIVLRGASVRRAGRR